MLKKKKNHHSITVLDVLVHSKSLLNSCRAIFIPSNKTELILCPSVHVQPVGIFFSKICKSCFLCRKKEISGNKFPVTLCCYFVYFIILF